MIPGAITALTAELAAIGTSSQNLTRVKFRRMDNIRGKTIAITGAARGIGYATAKALLARGARVVIGDRDVALQESAVADLTKLGPGIGLSARRHRPGVVRDVPRQGAHRRRRPHRRADQQRGRDADRPVPRTVRAGDPLVDRGQLLRRDRRLPAGAARHDRPPQRPHHQHRVAVRPDPGAGPGRLRRRQVRRGGAVRRAGRRGRAARRRRLGDHAAVHQHRIDLGHQEPAEPSSRWSPRTSPRRSSRHWRSRKPMSPCRLRCGSPRRRRRCSARAAGGGSTSALASTAFSWISTRRRQGYEQRAQAAQGVVESP